VGNVLPTFMPKEGRYLIFAGAKNKECSGLMVRVFTRGKLKYLHPDSHDAVPGMAMSGDGCS